MVLLVLESLVSYILAFCRTKILHELALQTQNAKPTLSYIAHYTTAHTHTTTYTQQHTHALHTTPHNKHITHTLTRTTLTQHSTHWRTRLFLSPPLLPAMVLAPPSRSSASQVWLVAYSSPPDLCCCLGYFLWWTPGCLPHRFLSGSLPLPRVLHSVDLRSSPSPVPLWLL